jgi:hypothetical protein
MMEFPNLERHEACCGYTTKPLKPGVYETSGDRKFTRAFYRRWDGTRWFDAEKTVNEAAVATATCGLPGYWRGLLVKPN